MTDILYFNGINAETGSYGLQPMTPMDLTRRIMAAQSQQSARLHKLERELQHRADTEAKLLALVDMLVQSNLDALRGAVDSEEIWADGVARKILHILLGHQALLPGEIDQLRRRLRERPRETIRMVANMLSRGQTASLARILLDDEVEDTVQLRESLERRLDQGIAEVQRRFLSGDAGAMDAEGYLRPTWLTSLRLALDRLPVPSMQILTGPEPLQTALRRLGAELSKSGVAISSGPDAMGGWVQYLMQRASADSPVLWHEIVSALVEGLAALQPLGVEVNWPRLSEALSVWLNALRRMMTGQLGVVPWIDPRDLSEAGWGIVFPAAMAPQRLEQIKAALHPLLSLRQHQAGPCFRFYAGKDGYRPGDSARTFMARSPRQVEVADPANPPQTGVPYYLLLVGGPDAIPFAFQYQLDVQYAVGRLDFGDDLAAYAHYAHNVVAAADEEVARARRAVFFGVDNDHDEATALSARHLVAPLRDRLAGLTDRDDWRLIRIASEYATKANLSRILSLDPPPAVLFVASHGIEMGSDADEQRGVQGALLCQDWDGSPGEVAPTTYFSAQDVTSSLNMRGMIAFFFACYSAGTPRSDEYARSRFRETGETLTSEPFVAALPQAMLALKDRGALAVIGHVERAWGTSFLAEMENRPEGMETRKREHIEVFASAFERLLDGYPVGAAMDFFNLRYAAIATELTSLYSILADEPSLADAYRLAELWTATYDARGYVVLGDPSVRLNHRRSSH